MKDEHKLKCNCGDNLDLRVWFDGCDWDSLEGEGSGFNYEISMH